MSEQAVFPHHDLTKEIAVLKKQLAIALKFHHSKTIEKLPKEIAMQVMGEVWASCHPEAEQATHNPKTTYSAPEPVICDDVPISNNGTIYL
ncbi:hypothetical protein [Acaryochloris marina]|uniref:Uncharacterized protein n=1 Tax=Acaryochloris marina (strain MBIC 11017) TaxID=329726 RepID=B0C4L9_ACAM1|nr:hypothetical protein [Acaryochloris marina]ABW29902.1 hypothetical protein AM1_4931 [Acaryochloris marina MBIC11017]BDM78778.1 hypothetical protein AM10699_16470 [Acaryochloris marina MBIC10699]